MSLIANINGFAGISSDESKGFVCPAAESKTIKYQYRYKDIQGAISNTREIVINFGNTTPDTQVYAVVLYFMPSEYDPTITSCDVYRSIETSTSTNQFKFVASIDHKDEGVFLDAPSLNDLSTAETALLIENISMFNYESGVAWSEPYQPSNIKESSFIEVQSGDGDQITGIESIFGNLVVFKENSIHRLTVQGKNMPISRTDEITPEYGCIAPNTLINVNNTLYFLSWKGFCMYDNNSLRKVDAAYSEELQFILNRYKGTPDEHILRDASACYNPTTNEIYLNMPWLEYYRTERPWIDKCILENGGIKYKDFSSVAIPNNVTYGHIFVTNLDKEYSTKFSYPMSRWSPFTSPLNDMDKVNDWAIKLVKNVRQSIRKYYLNSLGELRSADIMPIDYAGTGKGASTGYSAALCYLENPTGQDQTPEDEYPYIRESTSTLSSQRRIVYNNLRTFGYQNIIAPDGTQIDINSENYYNGTSTLRDVDNLVNSVRIFRFPMTIKLPILVAWKSKFFTGSNETLIKRVRKVFLNIFSWGNIKVISKSKNEKNYDDRMRQAPMTNIGETEEEFNFIPTVPYMDKTTNQIPAAWSNSNILSFTPTIKEPYAAADTSYNYRSPLSLSGAIPYGLGGTYQNPISLSVEEHEINKPIRYSIEIKSYGRVVIDGFTINWRPFQSYLR